MSHLNFSLALYYENASVYCIDEGILRKDPSWFHNNPYKYLQQILFLDLALIIIWQSLLQLILKPLGQAQVAAPLLVSILVGLGWDQNDTFKKSFSIDNLYVLETLGRFGCMLYLFIVGLKLDLSIVLTSTKKERLIGILTFIIPLSISVAPGQIIYKKFFPQGERNVIFEAYLIPLLESTTSFHTIFCFLTDLKITNSELGRIASTASTISGIFSWIALEITFTIKENEEGSMTLMNGFLLVLYLLAQILFITMVLRQIVIWIIKQTPHGEPIKEMYILSIFLMVLATVLIGEYFGRKSFIGPMILGLAIPDGPPVASALEDKLDALVSGMFLPYYYASVGYYMNMGQFNKTSFYMVGSFYLLGVIGKLLGTIIPCMIYRVPFRDAITLGLILCSFGIFDLTTYNRATDNEFVTQNNFAVLVVGGAILTGVIAPIVRILYNPSRRYIVYKQRNIQSVKNHTELRLLVCIYNEENVHTMINILEASNPTIQTPLAVYLLHLIELVGRSTPLLIVHRSREKLLDSFTSSGHIINSFKMYEKQNHGHVIVQPFTSITPFMSAHDDICQIALDKRTSFIILPFHQQRNIDGTIESSKYKNINDKVLHKAPCSVGILIDRARMNRSFTSIFSSCTPYNVGVIFLGGPDDREALCYAMRMARHPHINLIVHRIIPIGTMNIDVTEKVLDGDVINEFRLVNTDIGQNYYKEEKVNDGVEIINLIRSMENNYELLLVGKHHHTYSKLWSGLAEWSSHPELGFIGDLLASSDMNTNISVLVVNQHLDLPNN